MDIKTQFVFEAIKLTLNNYLHWNWVKYIIMSHDVVLCDTIRRKCAQHCKYYAESCFGGWYQRTRRQWGHSRLIFIDQHHPDQPCRLPLNNSITCYHFEISNNYGELIGKHEHRCVFQFSFLVGRNNIANWKFFVVSQQDVHATAMGLLPRFKSDWCQTANSVVWNLC